MPQNYLKAAELFLKSAEGGDRDAAANLGYYYEMGRGVERDMNKAKHYMRMAAEKGHSGAIEWLKHAGDKKEE